MKADSSDLLVSTVCMYLPVTLLVYSILSASYLSDLCDKHVYLSGCVMTYVGAGVGHSFGMCWEGNKSV